MARREIVQLFDDITGEEIADGEGESIAFTINGSEYSIDLAEKQAKKFHKSMKLYTDHATKLNGRRSSSTSAETRTGPRANEDLAAVREWARANGHEVSERGRLSASVLAAFEAAH